VARKGGGQNLPIWKKATIPLLYLQDFTHIYILVVCTQRQNWLLDVNFKLRPWAKLRKHKLFQFI